MAMDYVVTLRCSTRRRSLSTWPWTMCEGWEWSLGYMWCLTRARLAAVAARESAVVAAAPPAGSASAAAPQAGMWLVAKAAPQAPYCGWETQWEDANEDD